MKRTPNMSKDTIHRSQAHLRTHRHAPIKVSALQKLIAPGKHHAYHQNAGQADPAPNAKGGAELRPRISLRAGPTYKSP